MDGYRRHVDGVKGCRKVRCIKRITRLIKTIELLVHHHPENHRSQVREVEVLFEFTKLHKLPRVDDDIIVCSQNKEPLEMHIAIANSHHYSRESRCTTCISRRE